MEKVTELYFEETSFENMIDDIVKDVNSEKQSYFKHTDIEIAKDLMHRFQTRSKSIDLGIFIDTLEELNELDLLEKIKMYKKRYNMKDTYRYPYQKRKEQGLIN
jgi:hypothetical protein